MLGLSLVWAWKKQRGYTAKGLRFKGMMRLGAYALFAGACITGFTLHQAKADVAKSSLSFGRELAPLMDDMEGDAHHMKVNGQDLFMNVAYTDLSVAAVLDRYEAHCRANKGALGTLWKDVPRINDAAEKDDKLAAASRWGIVRREDRREGVIMCLVKGNGTPPSFGEAAQAFVSTKDLGALGKLRYAYVKKSSDGKQNRVLTVWTEDSFNFDKLVPADGSEPGGADAPGIPRPPESTRMMSASIEGTPFGVYIYRTKGTPEAAAGFYDKLFYEKGWMVFSPEVEGGVTKGFFKDGVVVTMSAMRDEDGATLVSLGTSSAPQGEDEARAKALRAVYR
jgi:hypothetical protein